MKVASMDSFDSQNLLELQFGDKFSVDVLSNGSYECPRVQYADGATGAVCIVTDHFRYLIGKHERPAIGKESWEFPRGSAKPGELPEETAARELKEETGIECEPLVLGSIYADTGILGNPIAVALCFARQNPRESDEFSDFRWVDRSELLYMISDGQIQDGITIAAFGLYEARN